MSEMRIRQIIHEAHAADIVCMCNVSISLSAWEIKKINNHWFRLQVK